MSSHTSGGLTEALPTLIERAAVAGLACWWFDQSGHLNEELSLQAFGRAGIDLGSRRPEETEGAVRVVAKRGGEVLGTLVVVMDPDAGGVAADAEYVRALFELALCDETSDQIIEDFTEHLTQAFENIQLLYRVGKAMSRPDDPAGFSSFLLDQILDSTPFRWGAIVLDDGPNLVEGVCSRTFVATEIEGTEDLVQREAKRLASSLREKQGGIFYDADSRLECQGTAHLIQSSGEIVGMLICGGKQGREADISSYDTQLLDVSAGHLGSVLETSYLYEQQAVMFLGTISSLIRALDAKDPYTRGHSDRVAALARQLARKAGLGEKLAERYHIAGLLHDVGKIGVPEAVLCKPGRLTDEEFGFIMKHPEIGFNILDGVPGMEDLLPGVMHHHERYDGKGYPHGLAGEDIPLIARVLCLADTFDAMSSNRAYRSAMTRDTVLGEIEKCAGTQFDPELAMLFIQMDFGEYDRMVARHVRQAAIDAKGKRAA
ncbi:MAG: HD-GYP domain-containing protein [Phycisphaerales bacterium JB050]